MAITDLTLTAETHFENSSYGINVVEGSNGKAEFTANYEDGDNAQNNNSVFIPLTAEECSALGKHLLALAERLKGKPPGRVGQAHSPK